MDDISSWAIYRYFCAKHPKTITWRRSVRLYFYFLINLLFARNLTCHIVSQQQRREERFYHPSASKFQPWTVALFSCHSSGVVGLPLRDH